MSPRPPAHLDRHAALWASDPRAAQQAWFAEAGYGLFIHYGLYALHGRGEWAEFRHGIPRAEYEAVVDAFDPSGFDAAAIADLALAAGMRYITLTTCHHEGFCLWRSAAEPFNSFEVCGRDLVAELLTACEQRGIGVFFYYTYVLNWHRDDAYPTELLRLGDMLEDEHRERLRRTHDLGPYWDHVHACLGELLAMDGPIAGIWLDIIRAAYVTPELVPVQRTYDLIRDRRPDLLLSYKQGVDGSEDFAAPERTGGSLAADFEQKGMGDAARRASAAWAANRHKHNEICAHLQHGGWGYVEGAAHDTPEELWDKLVAARAQGCNLLANVGPLPDGSIHPEDVHALRRVGERIRQQGLPPLGGGASLEEASHEGVG